MDDHFHIVCGVFQPDAPVPEAEVIRRIGILKGERFAAELAEHWSDLRSCGMDSVVDAALDGGSELKDALELEILSPAVTPKDLLSVYDPKGLTIANLKRLGFAVEEVKDIFAFDISRERRVRPL